MVLNAEDGSLSWNFRFPFSYAIAAPTSIADLDRDGQLEIIFFDWFQLGVLGSDGVLKWKYTIPGSPSSFRGAAISDVNNDDYLDIVFGTSDGKVYGVDGKSGYKLWEIDLRADIGLEDYGIDHAPVIDDFDLDGKLDAFIVGGHAEYPDIFNNYGRAYAISLESPGGPAWPMFRRDARRTACLCEENSTGQDRVLPASPPMLSFVAFGSGMKIYLNDDKQYTMMVFTTTGILVDHFPIKNSYWLEDLVPGIYFFQLSDKNTPLSSGRFHIVR
jgi:hypothetical protein